MKLLILSILFFASVYGKDIAKKDLKWVLTINEEKYDSGAIQLRKLQKMDPKESKLDIPEKIRDKLPKKVKKAVEAEENELVVKNIQNLLAPLTKKSRVFQSSDLKKGFDFPIDSLQLDCEMSVDDTTFLNYNVPKLKCTDRVSKVTSDTYLGQLCLKLLEGKENALVDIEYSKELNSFEYRASLYLRCFQ